MSYLGIIGTSRSGGQTAQLVREVFSGLDDGQIIDLNALNIGYFDYDYGNQGDDFLPIAQMMMRAETIVLASPVYWYTMSAQMKAFIDRFNDLTGPYKPLGKRLAGKRLYLVATGAQPTVPNSFDQPFVDLANYFDMRWGGMLYQQVRSESDDIIANSEISAFAQTVKSPIDLREAMLSI